MKASVAIPVASCLSHPGAVWLQSDVATLSHGDNTHTRTAVTLGCCGSDCLPLVPVLLVGFAGWLCTSAGSRRFGSWFFWPGASSGLLLLKWASLVYGSSGIFLFFSGRFYFSRFAGENPYGLFSLTCFWPYLNRRAPKLGSHSHYTRFFAFSR